MVDVFVLGNDLSMIVPFMVDVFVLGNDLSVIVPVWDGAPIFGERTKCDRPHFDGITNIRVKICVELFRFWMEGPD